MNTHRKVLGILYIITAMFQLIGFLFVSIFFATLFPLIINEAQGDEGIWILEWVSRFGQMMTFLIIIFISIPSLIAGVGLINQKRWAVIMALVLGCLKIFSFPIGTAIGVYAIWVYIEDQKQVSTN